MANKVETYKGQISEFTDWVTGNNSLTGENETNNLPVSGESIRNLLQTRLKSPVYLYYDLINNYYRGFSSEASCNLYLEDPITYSNLLLFSFVAPSPYTVTVENISVPKYIEKSSLSIDGKISYDWTISSNSTDLSLPLSVVYKVNGAVIDTVRYSASQRSVTYNLSNYLKDGFNEILITFSAVGVSASTTKSLQVYVVLLDTNILFNFALPYSKSDYPTLPYTVTGSEGYKKYINIFIDGNLYKSVITSELALCSGLEELDLSNLDPGKHTLQILVLTTIESTTYYSDLIYYEFIVSGLNTTNYKTTLLKSVFKGRGNIIFDSAHEFELTGTLYIQYNLEWAYYTSNPKITTGTVLWKLKYDETVELNLVTSYQNLTTTTETRGKLASDLLFFPEIYTDNGYLQAYVNDVLISEYKISITKSSENISEVLDYTLKLTAKGKNNNMPDTELINWSYTTHGTTFDTTFNNMLWDINSGWNNNALVLSNGASALIHFNPFSQVSWQGGPMNFKNTSLIQGRTFEIDFETFNVEDLSLNIIYFGGNTTASLQITPNSASVLDEDGEQIIKTNFKESERIKLQFIIYSNLGSDQHLDGKIIIVNNGIMERGASLVGVNLTIPDKYNADNKISNGINLVGTTNGLKIYSIKCYPFSITYDQAFYNYVLDSGTISTLLRKNNVYKDNVIDESLCEDKLDVILMTGNVEAVLADQSTTKSVSKPVIIKRICREDNSYNFTIVNARLRKHGQSTLNYAVPSFKIWSNYYSTSDGDSCDSIMYNTADIENMDEESLQTHVLYKGRYQMKSNAIKANKWVLLANYADSSGVHNGGLERLIQNTWYDAKIDNDYPLRTLPLQYITGTGLYSNDNWYSKTGTLFPYIIRNSPDSFPCVIFYRQNESDPYKFLGLYVFMDDKKSDYVYGQRSIYNVKTDPFCLEQVNKDKDTSTNRLWDNKDVLRFEIVLLNNNFVNFTDTVLNGKNWDEVIVYGNGLWKFAWLDSIELIYPEPEDLYKSTDSIEIQQQKVKNRILPFTNFVEWLVGTYKLDSGGPLSLSKFLSEASLHIDLYKMAAYYIFCMRHGLVDSMQRNVLVKTYDGIHFHFEPWDMDIAMGSRNTGGIAYNPPIYRDTASQEDVTDEEKEAEGFDSYAFSGHNCWLWNALCNWTTTYNSDGTIKVKGWSDNIVPTVAEALYQAGLTYENAIDMFDNEYLNKWCERIYNDSGYFKYLQEGGGSYLRFLNGARTTHRHWWLKTNYDYYDALWACGDFKTKRLSLTIIAPGWNNGYVSDQNLKVTAASSTQFTLASQDGALYGSTPLLSANETYSIHIQDSAFKGFSDKDLTNVYGAGNLQGLDASCVSRLLSAVKLDSCFDTVLGISKLKYLNIGIPWEAMVNYGVYHTLTLGLSIDYGGYTFGRLEELNVLGLYLNNLFSTFLASLTGLKVLKAAASNLTYITASTTGNNYTLLELPDTITSISLNDSSWLEIKFYQKNLDGKLNATPLTTIPETIKHMQFNGTTGKNDCCKELILKWANQITDFSNKTLLCDDINWLDVSYDDLVTLGNFLQNENSIIKGYVQLKSDTFANITDSEMSRKLQTLKNIYGEGCFELLSDSLKIDYAYNKLIITTDQNAIVENGEIVLYEGDSTELTCTLFKLVKDRNNTYDWSAVVEYNGSYHGLYPGSASVYGAYISSNGNLVINETTYDERVITVVAETYDEAGSTYISGETLIKIKKRNYPTSLTLTTDLVGNVVTKTDSFKVTSVISFPSENYQKNTQVLEYEWEVVKEDPTCNDISFEVGENKTLNEITISMGLLPDISKNIKVKLDVIYANGYILTDTLVLPCILNIVLALNITGRGRDRYFAFSYIIGSDNLIKPNLITSTDLAKLLEEVDLSNYPNISELESMYGYSNTSYKILNYLGNVQKLNFNGATSLRDFDFGRSNWYTHVYLKNCTSLSSIDISNLPIVELDLSGTNIDIDISNKPITLLKLGLPKNIKIIDCNSLESSNLTVDSYSNVNSIHVEGSNLDAFKRLSNIYSQLNS